MLNKVQLIGRLGNDPEFRNMPNGNGVCNFTLATSEQWRDKATGEKKERTEWHRVVSFNEGLNKVLEQYVRKGSMLYVEGSLQTRKWQDQSGNDRYSTEVVLQAFNGTIKMLGDKGGESKPAPAGDRRQPVADEVDDAIPF